LAIIAGILLKISATEWLFIVLCSMLVLMLELINTAVEYLCDTITTDFHPVIKIVKDISAAAVLISAAGSVITGLIIFLPKIIGF
jgi:diacylglycerol kinase